MVAYHSSDILKESKSVSELVLKLCLSLPIIATSLSNQQTKLIGDLDFLFWSWESLFDPLLSLVYELT